MTLVNTPNVKRHAGNDTTGPWDYPYFYADEDDIEFRYRLSDGTEGVFAPGTDYTIVSGGPGEPGGSVYQTTSAVATGTKLAIQAKTPAQQTSPADEINEFRAQGFEKTFDRQALTTRRHEDDIARAFISSPIDPGGEKTIKNMIPGFLLRVESVVEDQNGQQIVVIDGGNAQSQDLANPGNYISRDGSQPPTAAIPWGNQKITLLANGTAATDGMAHGQFSTWRDDNSGLLTMGGASNSYTLTTGQTLTALTDGLRLSAIANHTNTNLANLDVDGLGAKSIRHNGDQPLVRGDMIQGGHYEFQYDSTLNAGAGAWVLLNPKTVLLGEVAGEFTELRQRAAVAGLPVPSFYPKEADSICAVDIIPNGNPALNGGKKAWLHVCDRDCMGSGDTAAAEVAAGLTARFGSASFGSAPAINVDFVYNSTAVHKMQSGGISFNTLSLSGLGPGVAMLSSGVTTIIADSTAPMIVGRDTNDGNLLNWRRDTTTVAAISVSGGVVTYGTFLGSHWSQWSGSDRPETIRRGTIVSTVDDLCEWYAAEWVEDIQTGEERKGEKTITDKDGKERTVAVVDPVMEPQKVHVLYGGDARVGDTIEHVSHLTGETVQATIVQESNEHLPKFRVTEDDADTAVYGVFLGLDNDVDDGEIVGPNSAVDAFIAGVGAGFILVEKQHRVKRGDLIVSAGNGLGRPLAGSTMMTADLQAAVVGKITSAEPIETHDDATLYCCALSAS